MSTPIRFLKRQRNVAILACFSWFLLTGSSAAQSHPCDQVLPQSVVTSGAPLKIEFCAEVSKYPEAAIAVLDGTAADLQPVTQVSSDVNAKGEALFTTTNFLQVTRGQHILELRLVNTFNGEQRIGGLSLPFAFVGDDPKPLPGIAVIKRVVR